MEGHIKANPTKRCTAGDPRRGCRVVLPLLTLAAFLLALAAPPTALAQDNTYPTVKSPCHLKFPEDHGAHPQYRTEWWYYTGNLESESGKRFGFQLTFFRNRISPPGSERAWPQPHSAWRADQAYLAHAALSEITAHHFDHREKAARGALQLAGARQEDGTTTVFLGNWSAVLTPVRHTLRAAAGAFALDLSLIPLKEPVLHGESGYSLKGSTPERASCYYSFTRLDTRGTLTVAGKKFPVRGLAWMDHEFSSSPLQSDLAGWDWFSLPLSDHSELMIYLLRHPDGSYHPASSGTYVDARGKTVHLAHGDFSVQALGHWKSPHSGAVYPSGWKLTVPSLGMTLHIRPNLQDQEMETSASTRVTYWEGSVSMEGLSRGKPVSGNGYVELTGYAGSLEALH